MILAHRVALDGVQLDELDERINIKAVEEGAGKENIGAVNAAGGAGQRITNRRRSTLDVTVKFSLLITDDEMQERSTLLEKVNAWAAGGGWLTINYKENRRLFVVCAQAPGAGDQFSWTNVYTITFRAYALPYWEESTPTVAKSGVTTGGTSASAVAIQVNGSAETDAEVTLQNKSGMTIQHAVLNIGGSRMEFNSLNLGGSESLKVAHEYTDGLRVLKIYILNGSTERSAMACRTPASADDLILSPGRRWVNFAADRACQMTVEVRGRFV